MVSPRHIGQENRPESPERGRSVRRSEHEELVEAHRARMATAEAKALYKFRGQTVERAFAEFKAHRGMRRIQGRGLENARIQVGLTVLTHNLFVVHRALHSRSAASAPKQNPREIEV